MIGKSWVRQKAEGRGQKDFSFISTSALSESDLVSGEEDSRINVFFGLPQEGKRNLLPKTR